jgi:hypothetical protein
MRRLAAALAGIAEVSARRIESALALELVGTSSDAAAVAFLQTGSARAPRSGDTAAPRSRTSICRPLWPSAGVLSRAGLASARPAWAPGRSGCPNRTLSRPISVDRHRPLRTRFPRNRRFFAALSLRPNPLHTRGVAGRCARSTIGLRRRPGARGVQGVREYRYRDSKSANPVGEVAANRQYLRYRQGRRVDRRFAQVR